MVRKTALLAVVLALTMVGSAVTIAAVAQEQGDAGNQADDAVDAQSQSHLRLVHAASNAPAVDVSVDNETVASNVQFGDVSNYMNVSSGEVNVTVTPAANGTDGAEDAEPVIEQTVTVDSPTSTLVVHQPADALDTDPPELMLFDDDARTPGEDESAVRAVHLAPDGPDVNVTISSGDGMPDDVGADAGADNETEAGADNATDAGADNETDAGADNATDAGADNETDAGADNETDAGADNETDAGADNETDAGADNETDAGADNETEAGADGGAATEPDAGGQQTVVADSLSFNASSGYVTVPASDEATVEVGDDTVANDPMITTTETSLEGESAYTVWILPADDGADADAEAQAVVTPDATLTVELPENVSDQGPPDDAGENETETPEGENETETPEDEGETEAPEDEGETETPEEDETETPEDEEEDAATEEAE